MLWLIIRELNFERVLSMVVHLVCGDPASIEDLKRAIHMCQHPSLLATSLHYSYKFRNSLHSGRLNSSPLNHPYTLVGYAAGTPAGSVGISNGQNTTLPAASLGLAINGPFRIIFDIRPETLLTAVGSMPVLCIAWAI